MCISNKIRLGQIVLAIIILVISLVLVRYGSYLSREAHTW